MRRATVISQRSIGALASFPFAVLILQGRVGRGPVLLRRIALVREHPVRPPARRSPAGNVELVEYLGEHARVRNLPSGENKRQRPSLPVADKMDLRRQTAP